MRAGRLHRGTVMAGVAGLAVTGGFTMAARAAHENNEHRLIRQRAREAAAVITGSLNAVETPLASAAEIAETTGAQRAPFEHVMRNFVGAPPAPFVSVSVWALDRGGGRPVLRLGAPKLASRPNGFVAAFLRRTVESKTFTVVGLLDGDDPRIGYGYTTPARPVRYVAYAEAALPRTRVSPPERDNAFADLDFAIYLEREAPSALLVESRAAIPASERHASVRVRFGDSSLVLVAAARRDLGGRLLAALPWLILLVGLLATLAAMLFGELLARRRDDAERLSDELARVAQDNARLYADQRSVAQALQQSLLPDVLPDIDGLDVAVRYLPGVAGVDIGGDWYDVLPVPGGEVMFVVGDVSGRGVSAGTVMAALRYAARAYALEHHDPATILEKLSALVDVRRDGHFATVVCGFADVGAGRVRIANAGHPAPLLVHGGGAHFIDVPIGVPVGVKADAQYDQIEVAVGAGMTLLAYTDGLVERRGEDLATGFERLREAASADSSTVEAQLTTIVRALAAEHNDDDTAILGMRWLN